MTSDLDMAIIELNQVSYTYPGRKQESIKNLSLTIEKGEFILITGPSGCGKTTLCRCFNGLIPHFYQGEIKGEIKVAGYNVIQHEIFELAKHVGFVFQNPENQLFALSVEKDVAFGLENLGIPRNEMRERVDWALKLTNTEELRKRAPHELSGGQQQRVAIASVLAMNPEVIVLDEPTSFLDPLGAKQIFEVINDLNKKLEVTIVLIEHRLDLTAKYANHIIALDNGSIVLEGDPREVLNSIEAQLMGIGIPKATKLFQLLVKDNLITHKKPIPLWSDEMTEILREILIP